MDRVNPQATLDPVKANFMPLPINLDFFAQFNLQVVVWAKDEHVRWVVTDWTDN